KADRARARRSWARRACRNAPPLAPRPPPAKAAPDRRNDRCGRASRAPKLRTAPRRRNLPARLAPDDWTRAAALAAPRMGPQLPARARDEGPPAARRLAARALRPPAAYARSRAECQPAYGAATLQPAPGSPRP